MLHIHNIERYLIHYYSSVNSDLHIVFDPCIQNTKFIIHKK